VSDATSGPVTTTVGAAAVVSSAGNKTVDLTGADHAGNATTATCPYRVSYLVVAKSPAASASFKAGSTIPVKLELSAANGTRISDAVAQGLVAGCRVKVGLGDANGCATYVASSDAFQFDLKTPKNVSGSHQIAVDVFAPDGTGLVNHELTPITLRR
jgi:hypothetical protein